jgi:ribosome-associated translation inhibitor RaiA
VLECWVAGLPKMVGTSTERDLTKAVTEVRDDLFKQIDKHLTKRDSARRR